MANKEMPTCVKQSSATFEQLALRCLVEIDHHIPAEDHVERPAHGPGMHEIQLAERNELLEFWPHTHQAGMAALPLPKPALQTLGRHPLDTLSVVHTLLGCCQHVGVDICGQ